MQRRSVTVPHHPRLTVTLLGFLVLLLVAGICGAVAAALIGFSAGGCLLSVGIGLLGAFIGPWIAAQVGAPALLPLNVEGAEIDVVWTIIGAVVVLVPLVLIRRGAGTRI